MVGGIFAVLALGGAFLYVRAWYLRNEHEILTFLAWAGPLTVAVLVFLAVLLVRARLREARNNSIARAKRRAGALSAQRQASLAEAASQPGVEIELPPRQYLYRVWGHWQNPNTGDWHHDVLLYIGRSIDFLTRRKQHDIDSWWAPNATRSAEEYIDSYIDPASGAIVSSFDLVKAAEKQAIEVEGPKHNIQHNGELGRRERELRAAIRAARAA